MMQARSLPPIEQIPLTPPVGISFKNFELAEGAEIAVRERIEATVDEIPKLWNHTIKVLFVLHERPEGRDLFTARFSVWGPNVAPMILENSHERFFEAFEEALKRLAESVK